MLIWRSIYETTDSKIYKALEGQLRDQEFGGASISYLS